MSNSSNKPRGIIQEKGNASNRQDAEEGRILLTRAENIVLVMDTPKGKRAALRDFEIGD